MFYFVINHFEPSGAEAHLQASTVFAASLAVRAPEVATVMVVDGSAEAHPELAERLAAMGVRYHHDGRRLTFSEGYNTGLALSDQPWTILCASDVYPSLTIFRSLGAFIARAQVETIGCIVPQLSYSDLPLQMDAGRGKHPLSIPLMTLNFNVFLTDYLRSVGGVPGAFTGNFNDVLLAERIQADGRRIVMLPDRCVHYGSLTIGSGATGVSQQRDRDQLADTRPDLFERDGFWHLDLRRFTRSPLLRLALNATSRVYPKRLRRPLSERAMRYLVRSGLA